ncbi:aldehyde dehydrogenase family protein [Crenobacter caeni]|uniref:Aldehyde dehydrogenase family protein n=1 Tax=Crenobacter caeni TaxID=2705474 RepID=A0A6B2KT99_9NEIS|nr:aldehyde dehydrogenase family protein [Crenobacter caeni]NDV13219.1 aldehyde dehydrogenase family protein [Crenobacter caeni]
MNAYTSCNSATGEVVHTRPAWTADQLAACVHRLREARAHWAAQPVTDRATALRAMADALERRREELAALVTLEVGKRTAECLAEIDKSVQLIRYYAELAPRLLAARDIPTQASRSGVSFEPLGLVLAVMPWNYPVWQVLRFAVPALIAGNGCLVKPAPSVPLASSLLTDIVQGSGIATFDTAWLANEEVEDAIRLSDAVAFTGSTATGRVIAGLAGRHLKKSVLELGGSNPFIVLADADLDEAAYEAAHSRFRDAGQSCNAAKRLIVVPEIADAFVERFTAHARALRLGPPTDAATTLGPLARADLREALHAQVLDAIQHGARLLCGGQMSGGAGFYYPATVLDAVNPRCRVWHEEVFGPVASVIRVADEDEAIRVANDTPFGLGASIFSADTHRARALGARIEAGAVYINRYTSSDLRLPFGGVKASGYGRELSEFGLYEFVNVKTWWQK